MTPSDNRNNDHAAHVAAQKTEASFREHTAGAEAKLEIAEDKLEAAARKVETR